MTVRRALNQYSVPYLAWWAARRSYRLLTGPARVLPDFIVVGAQRCGTTSLYNYLVDHPNVAPAFMKETHFFDNHFRKGLAWYRAFFPLRAYKAYTERVHRQRLAVGEASPYYLFHPHVPRRVHATLPGVRLIVLLRNPVDRAYSHYHHEVSTGFESASFEGALDREEVRLPGETDRLLRDETYCSFDHFHYSYLARGIYVDQLERWVELFDRDQMLVIRTEDFYADPEATVMRVQGFLELPLWKSGRYKQYNLGHYTDMEAGTRRRLVEYFRPHNEKLHELLGTDFGWG